MLLTTSLGSGSFENGYERKLAKNIYSSSDFQWIFGLLIGIYDVMSMIISELQLSVTFGLRGQKFIQQQMVSFANGHHEKHELLISRIFVPVVSSVPFDSITILTIITKNNFV